ncbi:MAG: hypothetical protein HKL84_07595 [Acidimicrobiaceae bacterium]|nr:hypothetical protein [Acidimicrobiaceae bacterium]
MSIVDLFEKIPGQDRLASELQAHFQNPRNSYFFIGPQDAGVLEAAKAFAKAILCLEAGCGKCQSCIAIERNSHPDVAVYERTGPFLMVDDAREIVNLAFRSTSGSKYRIIIVPELDLVGKAAPTLLKSVEEPPESTIFLLLASTEVPELRTLMSRSVVLKFDPLSDEQIYSYLHDVGYSDEVSAEAVRLSAGRWSRAVKLASDPELREKLGLWEELPKLLAQDTAEIIKLADRLISVAGLMEDRRSNEQKKEVKEVTELAKAQGDLRESTVKRLEDQHHRELRRIRTAEFRAGLLLLERYYRNQIVLSGHEPSRHKYLIDVISQIEEAQQALRRNCNEFLMLVALLSRLAGKGS